MGEGAYVSAIEGLSEFAARYKNFAQSVREILAQVEINFHHRWETLEECYRLQQKRVAELRCLVEELRDKEQVADVRRRLEEAEERLHRMRQALYRVQGQYETYRRYAQGLLQLATELAPKAVSFLQDRVRDLEAYLSVEVPLPERPASGPYVPVSPTPLADADMTRYALPEGFQWVPLEAIHMEGVLGKDEFRKVSWEEMLEGMRKLPEVLEVLKDRMNQPFIDNSVYLMQLDRQAGREYATGLQKIYESFFGSEPIRLEPYVDSEGNFTNKWMIINGRHRIQVAKELKWPAVPAICSGLAMCPTCKGRGVFYYRHRYPPGLAIERLERSRSPDRAEPCPRCLGQGKVKIEVRGNP
ncbi:MAG: zinc finger-like domain-containing protein [Candidatus Methanomethylicaceae archaeon]